MHAINANPHTLHRRHEGGTHGYVHAAVVRLLLAAHGRCERSRLRNELKCRSRACRWTTQGCVTRTQMFGETPKYSFRPTSLTPEQVVLPGERTKLYDPSSGIKIGKILLLTKSTTGRPGGAITRESQRGRRACVCAVVSPATGACQASDRLVLSILSVGTIQRLA